MNVEDPLCGCIEAQCICSLPHGHDGPHVCGCKGSWHFDDDGEFIADVWPEEMGPLEAIGSYLGFLR